MAAKYYYRVMGEIIGPLSAADLREHAADGRLEREYVVRQGEDGKWVPADKIRGLFPAPVTPQPVEAAPEPTKSDVTPPLAQSPAPPPVHEPPKEPVPDQEPIPPIDKEELRVACERIMWVAARHRTAKSVLLLLVWVLLALLIWLPSLSGLRGFLIPERPLTDSVFLAELVACAAVVLFIFWELRYSTDPVAVASEMLALDLIPLAIRGIDRRKKLLRSAVELPLPYQQALDAADGFALAPFMVRQSIHNGFSESAYKLRLWHCGGIGLREGFKVGLLFLFPSLCLTLVANKPGQPVPSTPAVLITATVVFPIVQMVLLVAVVSLLRGAPSRVVAIVAPVVAAAGFALLCQFSGIPLKEWRTLGEWGKDILPVDLAALVVIVLSSLLGVILVVALGGALGLLIGLPLALSALIRANRLPAQGVSRMSIWVAIPSSLVWLVLCPIVGFVLGILATAVFFVTLVGGVKPVTVTLDCVPFGLNFLATTAPPKRKEEP